MLFSMLRPSQSLKQPNNSIDLMVRVQSDILASCQLSQIIPRFALSHAHEGATGVLLYMVYVEKQLEDIP